MSSTGSYKLGFCAIEATFMVAAALDRLAVDRDKIAHLLATPAWYHDFVRRATGKDLAVAFSELRQDILQYPEQPSPEKQPINKLYFAQHGSVACDFLAAAVDGTKDAYLVSTTVRLFESGAVGAACSVKSRDPKKAYDVDTAVVALRESRGAARRTMFQAVRALIELWNKVYPDCQLMQPANEQEALLFEQYEYLDFDIRSEEAPSPIKALADQDVTIPHLRELVGFCRMAKPYAWTKYSVDFLKEFMRNDVSSRDDELWLAYPERFVRCFPDKDVPETGAYAADIVLVSEVLLALRAVYKSLLEETRARMISVPGGFVGAGTRPDAPIGGLQEALATSTYRLSRCRFPPDVGFYAGSAFAARVLRQIESALDLDRLSSSLLSEMNKLKNTIDSYAGLIIHEQGMALQRRVFWLTVVVGLAGILLASAQVAAAFLG